MARIIYLTSPIADAQDSNVTVTTRNKLRS